MRGILFFFLAALVLEQTRPHDLERFLLVLLLAAPVLAADNSSGRNMQDLDGRIGRIDPLPARAARAANFNTQILRFQLDIDIFRFRQHRHGGGGSMNSPLRFGRGHALHAMYPALKPQFPKDRFARNLENGFF